MIRWFKRWPGNFGIFTFMIDVAGTGVRRPLGAGRPGKPAEPRCTAEPSSESPLTNSQCFA
jgi:hypothetical protein